MEPEITRSNNHPEPEVNKPEVEEVSQPANTIFDENFFQEDDSYEEENWLLFGYKASELIDALPDYIKYFWSAYKRVILAFAFILVALLTFKVLAATLNALDEIPFVAAVFQLVGIGYTIWFIFRYVVTVEKRQELIGRVEYIKKYTIG